MNTCDNGSRMVCYRIDNRKNLLLFAFAVFIIYCEKQFYVYEKLSSLP